MVKIYSTFYKLFHLIDFLGIWFKFMNVRFGTGVGGHQSLMILFYEWRLPGLEELRGIPGQVAS